MEKNIIIYNSIYFSSPCIFDKHVIFIISAFIALINKFLSFLVECHHPHGSIQTLASKTCFVSFNKGFNFKKIMVEITHSN